MSLKGRAIAVNGEAGLASFQTCACKLMRMPPHRTLVQIAKKKLLRKKSARSTAVAGAAITAKERLVEKVKKHQDGAKPDAG